MKVEPRSQTRAENVVYSMPKAATRHENSDSPQRDSIMDNSDLSMVVREGSFLRDESISSPKKVAFPKGSKKDKKKYKLVYQVQKMKVPASLAAQVSLVSKRNTTEVSEWNSALPDPFNKFKQSKSVKPR